MSFSKHQMQVFCRRARI